MLFQRFNSLKGLHSQLVFIELRFLINFTLFSEFLRFPSVIGLPHHPIADFRKRELFPVNFENRFVGI
ncbi:hypothetical protein SJ05684_c21640 [Sinorhizobium sojae CCBAU 05684]|uniref:Uncharacterized protein n=1 Tax=Sinorhizobium sojae CCBAU 05684 TaxID=716928 RepID=A0A249PCW0_9HYPH|nr:hypothetical protein SJ05684_c21640 [Sinorhizobium sojae CCBAU 05684]